MSYSVCRNSPPNTMFASGSASIFVTTGLFSRPGVLSIREYWVPCCSCGPATGMAAELVWPSEWRAQPQRSGGGELIDQGVHLIDLARWFFGEFVEVSGFAHTYFWDMPVDDNAFMVLKTTTKQVPFYMSVAPNGRTRSPGSSTVATASCRSMDWAAATAWSACHWYKNLPEMGPPETTIWEYPMADNSRETEMAEFIEDIRAARAPVGRVARRHRGARRGGQNLRGLRI